MYAGGRYATDTAEMAFSTLYVSVVVVGGGLIMASASVEQCGVLIQSNETARHPIHSAPISLRKLQS